MGASKPAAKDQRSWKGLEEGETKGSRWNAFVDAFVMLLTADKGGGRQNGVAEQNMAPSWYGTQCVSLSTSADGSC